MYRIRLSLPARSAVQYRYLDLIHDALVTAWTAAGADGEQVTGANARPWAFAALGRHQGHTGLAHSLVVTTADPLLSEHLRNFDPGALHYARAATSELCDFSAATLSEEPNPIVPGQGVLSALLLSPLAVRQRSGAKRHWHTDLSQIDLSDVVNRRLSRLAGRPIKLQVQADSLYLRANPRHSVLVATKGASRGRTAFVLAMQAPLILAGSDRDLALAWYAGIGEKTRNGFGCLGELEQGVGR